MLRSHDIWYPSWAVLSHAIHILVEVFLFSPCHSYSLVIEFALFPIEILCYPSNKTYIQFYHAITSMIFLHRLGVSPMGSLHGQKLCHVTNFDLVDMEIHV